MSGEEETGNGAGTSAPEHGATNDVEDIDETLLAAELDREFDEIRAEIDRINVQERVGGPTKRMLLQQYRTARKASRKVDANRPPWRVRLDEALESTIDKFVEEGLEERADGTIALVFKSELIGTHGVPLLTALLDAMRAGLKDNEGKGGPMAAIGPHIIRFIENFRTSFAGAPPEDLASKGAAHGGDTAAEPTKGAAPELPPLSMGDVLKGFTGLLASAQASAKKGGAGKSGKPGGHPGGKKGGKPTTTTFTMKTSTDAPTTGQGATGGAAQSGGAKSDGPTINIDFAGLFGSLLQGMTQAKPGGPPPASPKPAPAAAPKDAPTPTETPKPGEDEPKS